MRVLQSAVRWLYPPQCSGCGTRTVDDFEFCGECWSDLHLVLGLACDLCGAPLAGEADGVELCDACLAVERPWSKGRAVFRYEGKARELVLGLKYGDRTDLVPALGPLMARAARDLLEDDPLIVSVPLHWSRTLKRRYNQSALLAQALARVSGLDAAPTALARVRRTAVLRGLGAEARFELLAGSITAREPERLRDRTVLLVDDVMTSGATFTAATEASLAAGAKRVFVLALARAAKDA